MFQEFFWQEHFDSLKKMETCTEIQSRRNDYLIAGYENYPEFVTIFIIIGFDPITLKEIYCVDNFDSCE